MKQGISKKWFTLLVLSLIAVIVQGQTTTLSGTVITKDGPVEFAHIIVQSTSSLTYTDQAGIYRIPDLSPGKYTVKVTAIGYKSTEKHVALRDNESIELNFELEPTSAILEQVVISGTMKEVSRLDSPVPVEVFSSRFFRANPNPTMFEALQHVNGVRPQINCNVCNTGDIHINGMEGPYTMVLIDGMPIVSGLATVYGLNGIPQSLIDRIEVVKGPASTLYGSEAVGGLINVITKNPLATDPFSVDVWGTDWKELNADIAGRFSIGELAHTLVGMNTYHYQNPIDQNNDGFTDVTLQNRVSLFNKWEIMEDQDRILSFAARYVYEDRWGGEMNWNPVYRGGEEIYGESIYTSRWEMFGTYHFPLVDDLKVQFSAIGHDQDSRYGNTSYIADQRISFGQITWRKSLKNNEVLMGASFRHTYYDDNTPATGPSEPNADEPNAPSRISLPGLFVQDEIQFRDNQKLLLGVRYDYNSIHGSIVSPRLNYKWATSDNETVLRLSLGNGYRVANIFTEDHAALTGARQVEFWEDLKPERSWNGNINFVQKFYLDRGAYIGIDASAFYTYFSNKILVDYEIDPNKIIYQNLNGKAVSQGLSLNSDMSFPGGLTVILGGTYQDVFSVTDQVKTKQLFTEQFSGVWTVSYNFHKLKMKVDYTGNLYSPMRLPLLSDLDPRSEYSPWWSIQNIQITGTFQNNLEVYGGVKNLLNWTPAKGSPFIIARSHDPFDREVQFDAEGNAIPSVANPYGLTFDPSYVYGPNQGLRVFLGVRYSLE